MIIELVEGKVFFTRFVDGRNTSRVLVRYKGGGVDDAGDITPAKLKKIMGWLE